MDPNIASLEASLDALQGGLALAHVKANGGHIGHLEAGMKQYGYGVLSLHVQFWLKAEDLQRFAEEMKRRGAHVAIKGPRLLVAKDEEKLRELLTCVGDE